MHLPVFFPVVALSRFCQFLWIWSFRPPSRTMTKSAVSHFIFAFNAIAFSSFRQYLFCFSFSVRGTNQLRRIFVNFLYFFDDVKWIQLNSLLFASSLFSVASLNIFNLCKIVFISLWLLNYLLTVLTNFVRLSCANRYHHRHSSAMIYCYPLHWQIYRAPPNVQWLLPCMDWCSHYSDSHVGVHCTWAILHFDKTLFAANWPDSIWWHRRNMVAPVQLYHILVVSHLLADRPHLSHEWDRCCRQSVNESRKEEKRD